ncbi:hypothetical protein [Methanotorris formicicus]|uniref:Transglutaminase-like domain-containing protein n=1 Tax=Methanotorris formicicus Mc-S-70 TaxID=647171 RepID=H1KYY5_9EURY|nr:hypothetical protein [Methanotorris formicicus]EHP86565.1 hypothetical protein MetfoDRAFT_1005 [Methanotorris formicicus Mc-S-70]
MRFVSYLMCISIVLFCGCYEELNNTNNNNNNAVDSIFLDHDVPKNYPNMDRFPKNYYKISDEMYPDVKKRDINTLRYILKTIKLPPYEENYYDCSEASCQLEWILEGYGFKTYIACGTVIDSETKKPIGHTWLLVQLDDGKIVAVESTCLCENNYNPDCVIRYEDYYYHPEFYVDTPDMLLIPHNNKRLLITQVDWWNHPKNIKIKKEIFNI